MTHVLNEEEKASLKVLIEHPVLRRALELALGDIWVAKKGAETLEASALAFHYYDGACDVVNKLYAAGEVKQSLMVTPRRLRHQAK